MVFSALMRELMNAKLLQIGVLGRVIHATPQTELSVWTTQNCAGIQHSGGRITSPVIGIEAKDCMVLGRDVQQATSTAPFHGLQCMML